MTVKCPWCPWAGDEKDYSEHLQKHYKDIDGVKVGPFPNIEEG